MAETKDDVRKLGTVVVRCHFPRALIKRINRAAKLRGINRGYLLRSWLELIAEGELQAIEDEYGIRD
jgi:hypothetical protein